MVTENRLNWDHFWDSNTSPRVNFFEFLFWLTCSASSAVDLFIISLGTLCLWTSEFGLKSDYIQQILRSLAVLSSHLFKIFRYKSSTGPIYD